MPGWCRPSYCHPLPTLRRIMSVGTLRGQKKKCVLRKTKIWYTCLSALLAARGAGHNVDGLLLICVQNYGRSVVDLYLRQRRVNRLSTTNFTFNFNSLSEEQCLLQFRFTREYVEKMVSVVGWPAGMTHSSRNRYSCSPILCTCVLLRRLATPCRWTDLELLFGKHTPQLSEIFWETLESFLELRKSLVFGHVREDFIKPRLERYADAIYAKTNALDNCVGHIDGTVLGIARPNEQGLQEVVYNGHKRKHALKFQAITAPDGLFLHCYGPMEGRRHDWTLYVRSNMDAQLESAMYHDAREYCIYGDSGYNARWFLECPFQGADLNANQRAFNAAMAESRVTVEWAFKEVKCYWTTVDFKRKMRLKESPIGALYQAAVVLTNMRACVYPNQTSQYFDCAPPSLEEYVGIDL